MTSPDRPPRADLAKAFAASLSGTALEWYDFSIYSAAAALVFPRLFFPGSDPLTGVLLSFSTYAVGYAARPIGGFVFGRLGDRIGRRQVLVTTLTMIGAATVLIGLLPTYASVGVTAPIALVLLRFVQGVGLGGEWGSAVLLSAEFGSARRRGFWSSAAQVGPPAGNLLSNGVLALLTALLTPDAFLSWGWRVAFLLSALLVGAGLLIRLRLEDTPVFRAIAARGDQPSAPLRELFTTQARPLVAAILSRVGPDILYALFTVFVITYATRTLGFSNGQALAAVLVGSALQVVTMPLAGALSDRLNRRLVYGVGALGGLAWTFVFFLMVEARSPALLVLGVLVGLVFHSLMYGPQAAFVVEQFDPRLRSTGSAVAYTVAGLFGGATAPLIFTELLAVWQSWVPLALYLAVGLLVTVAGLALGRDPRPDEDDDGDGASGQKASSNRDVASM